LEQVYRGTGRLDENTLKSRGYVPLSGTVRALLRPIDVMRIKSMEVAPGVTAILGGGGNSLVLKDGREALLVDSKWRPFSGRLRRWIQRHAGVPVTTLVNTHFHFDHTSGNVLFPEARIIAHKTAPELMRKRDSHWWRLNPDGVPRPENLIEGGHTLQVGEQEVTIHHAGQGHTVSDLWVHFRRGDLDVIATGDVASLGVHPFFDLGEGGADILNMVKTLRHWVSAYPNAVFVPGHGPVAAAADLAQHADYLEFLWEFVGRAREEGLTENETIARIDLTRYRLANLPIFHYGARFLSARSNIRSVYRLQMRADG
jgi:glyoxylase-like metal-dependent hydrolase (beta-lactamase superfamily II)